MNEFKIYIFLGKEINTLFTNKSLKKMIIPLVIEQVLVMLVGMADTVMVSSAGEAAISGVSLVNMVNNLIICILAAVATGGAVIVSQYLGSGDKKRSNLAASQLITITVIISTIIMVLCLLFHNALLQAFFGSVEIDVMKASITYFVISSISFPFLGIYNSTTALFRSMGKTNVTMYVSLLMNVINIIGNAIGIFVLHAGVAGVAVPTLISRAIAAMIMLYLSFNANNQIALKMKDIFSWNKIMINKILNIAVPNGIENGLFHLGKVLVTSIIAMFGTSQIAANGVANSVDMIAIIVVNAINLAIVTVVGQCVGANEYDQAEYYTKKLMKVSYIATAIISLIVFVGLKPILSLFTLSDAAYEYSYWLIIIHNVLAIVLHPTSFVLPNGIRAAGDVKFTMYVGILSMIIFRLGTAYLFGIVFNLGVYGVWIAMGADWMFRSILFTIRLKSNKWREFRAI